MKNVLSKTLPNGLRLLLKEDHAWPWITLHAWVHVGSVDEDPARAGISHVIEHMVFKGTTHFRGPEIARWVETEGGSINAETSREYTHYHLDLPSSAAQTGVQLLGELLHQARWTESDWMREKPVILEEIKRRNDDHDSLLWDLLNQAVFDEDRFKRPVIGFPETVGSFTVEQLRTFYRAAYTARRSLVVIVGDFQAARIMGWLRSACGGMVAGGDFNRSSSSAIPRLPQELAVRKRVRQTYLGMGFPTPSARHPDQEALDLLAVLLGEGRSSRLVRILREEKKWVWSISALNWSQEGPGLFAVFAECPPARRERVIRAVRHILMEYSRRPPSTAELARAKALVQTSWCQGLETYHQQASTLGLYALDRQLDRLDKYLPRLLALTRRQIQSVARRYLQAAPLSTAVIEPAA